MTTKLTSNYTADWRWAAAGAVGMYATGLLLIFNALPFLCGGIAVASVCSFFKSVQKKPNAKPLHQFVPKHTNNKTLDPFVSKTERQQ